MKLVSYNIQYGFGSDGRYDLERIARIVDGADSVDACGERIFRLILDTASGRKSKSELHGYGQNEFVPWQLGAVM